MLVLLRGDLVIARGVGTSATSTCRSALLEIVLVRIIKTTLRLLSLILSQMILNPGLLMLPLILVSQW